MNSINYEEIFVNRGSKFESSPCDSPEDYKIAEAINHEMEDARREFQAKVESTNQLCANFRFSRY